MSTTKDTWPRERPVLNQYLAHLTGERELSANTVRNYRDDLKLLFEFMDDSRLTSVTKIDRSFLRRYIAWLMSSRPVRSGNHKTNRGHKRGSVVRAIASLRSFFRYLIREQIVPPSPIWQRGSRQSRALIPKTPVTLPHIIARDDIAKLVQSPVDPELSSKPRGSIIPLRDLAILETLYATGLRVSEIAGLNLEDVYIARKRIRTKGKGGKEREVLMGSKAQNALRSYLANGRPSLVSKGRTNALFLNRFGNRLSTRSIQNMVKHYGMASIGIRVHPHMIRHTFATHMIDGGADLRIVQELLGHSSPTTTQIYTQVSTALARKEYLMAHPRAKSKSMLT